MTSLTVTEDDFGNLSLSQEAIRDLTFHPVEKVDEEKIGDGLTLTFSLIEEMHQDANLSIFKQRRYRVTTLDESIFGTKIDKDIIIDHETYSKIWAHLISDKARRMKIQLKLGKPPKENYWRWRLKTLSDLFKFQPPRVGDFLKRGDNLALNSWHTIPYFSHSETSIFSMNNDRVQIESKHEDSFLFLYHLSNDRILEGCNFNLIPKRATSSFEDMDFFVKKHHDVYRQNASPTGGFVDIMFDETEFLDNQSVVHFICSDLNRFDPGLRVIYSRNTEKFNLNDLDSNPVPENFTKTMFRWTATKISSLRYAHRKPRVEEKPKERTPQWIHYDKSKMEWVFSNPVYGEKIGFSSEYDVSEGLAEFSSKYFGILTWS